MNPYMMAWKWVFDHWQCSEWTPIAKSVSNALHLREGLGMFNGQLVSRQAAVGMREFVSRVNRARKE